MTTLSTLSVVESYMMNAQNRPAVDEVTGQQCSC